MCAPMSKLMMRGIVLALVACASPTLASPLKFDCDVPPDKFSSISQEIEGVSSITGTIQVIELRSGKNLPVAGARLVSADGTSSVGLQLVADSVRAKTLDVVFNRKRGESIEREVVGQIDLGSPIRFGLAVSPVGQATLTVNGSAYDAGFVALPVGTAMAFCSTGQFKFSDLRISEGSGIAAPK